MSELEALERRLAELRARLPRHSIPPAMLQELEELEEELARQKAQGQGGSEDADLRIPLPPLRPGV